MFRWYVARTKPRKEKIACQNISNQEIKVDVMGWTAPAPR